jgi:hypothetical protein
LREAGYIGSSAAEDQNLRGRLREQIEIEGRWARPGRRSPGGVQHVLTLLNTRDGRTQFRLDIGSIKPPGSVRNPNTIFFLEKLLQRKEESHGNQIRGSRGRTFEELFEEMNL